MTSLDMGDIFNLPRYTQLEVCNTLEYPWYSISLKDGDIVELIGPSLVGSGGWGANCLYNGSYYHIPPCFLIGKN